MADLLSRSRLVTVVGPGGVGKTRVAHAVTRELEVAYQDGVWQSDLSEAADIGRIWESLATALPVERGEERDTAERVMDHLRVRQALVVLDSCEHVAAECATVALSLVHACPDVSILLTSRQALGVVGERLWPVAGLDVDAGGGPGPSPAVRLFVERAKARLPDLAFGPEESRVVAELCRRVDGLPLAIELAAARIPVLSPHEMLEWLHDDPLALLAGGSAAIAPRHRSMAATLSWSHRLLTPDETVVFRRLAVFVGGFTLAAANAVCATPSLLKSSLLDVMSSLVAKSLVVAAPVAAQSRYRLLATTRAYAAARLADHGEVESVRERHARWFSSLAKEADRNLGLPTAECWSARLRADHANVDAALEWMMSAQRTDCALEMAAAMASYWGRTRLFDTGRASLTRALTMPHQRAELRIAALVRLAQLIGDSGDRTGAVHVLEEALRLAEECGDTAAEARALHLLGYFRLFVETPTTARPPLERSTQRARSVGDHPTLLLCLSTAGWVAMFEGDAAAAASRFDECLAAAKASEHGEGATWAAVVGLGSAALAQGRYDEAEARLREALATADRMGLKQAQSVAWCFLGQLARARGDYDRASALLGRSLSDAREAANWFAITMRLGLLGALAHDQGHLVAADAALVEATSAAVPATLPFARAQCVVALGSLRVTEGRGSEAAAFLDEGAAIAKAHGFGGLLSAALLEEGRRRRLGDNLEGAARSLIEAIGLRDRLGDRPGLVDALEELGGVRARQGRSRVACRLLAAASAIRCDLGVVRAPVRVSGYETDLLLARSGLPPREWDAVWAAGESLSPAAAALAVKGPGRRDTARTGWDAITPTEREVLALVAQGLTNREAAARLVISPRTVETHVAHVLTKLGIASRRELARVASDKGFGSRLAVDGDISQR